VPTADSPAKARRRGGASGLYLLARHAGRRSGMRDSLAPVGGREARRTAQSRRARPVRGLASTRRSRNALAADEGLAGPDTSSFRQAMWCGHRGSNKLLLTSEGTEGRAGAHRVAAPGIELRGPATRRCFFQMRSYPSAHVRLELSERLGVRSTGSTSAARHPRVARAGCRPRGGPDVCPEAAVMTVVLDGRPGRPAGSTSRSAIRPSSTVLYGTEASYAGTSFLKAGDLGLDALRLRP